MRHHAWGAATTLACVLAACTCFAAVGLHALEIAAGYDLGREQARHATLARDLRAAEQRVAGLRSPSAVLARGREMGLVTEFTEFPLVVYVDDVIYMLSEDDSRFETYARMEVR